MTFRPDPLFRGFSRPRFVEATLVAVLIAGFLAVHIAYPRLNDRQFAEPGAEGLNMQQSQAARIVSLLKREPISRLFLEGRLPMTSAAPYHGNLMAYLYVPFHAFLGPNYWMRKFWHLLFVPPTLLFFYFLIRMHFGRGAALAALLLLVVHPTYMIGVRDGNHLWSHMQFFSMGALFFFYRWWHTRRAVHLCAGSLLTGMGMCTQVWFYWFVAGLAAAACLRAPDFVDLYGRRRRELAGLIGLGAVSFLAGASTRVYHELRHQLYATRVLFDYAADSSNPHGIQHYFRRLPETLADLNGALSSGQAFYPYLVWGSVALCAIRAIARREKRFLTLPAIFLVIVMLTPLAVTEIGTQLFFIYPFPQLMIAWALGGGLLLLARRKRTAALLLFLAVVVPGEIRRAAPFIGELRTENRRREVLYRLADWLKENGPGGKIVMVYLDRERGKAVKWHLKSYLDKTKINHVSLDWAPAKRVVDFLWKRRTLPDRLEFVIAGPRSFAEPRPAVPPAPAWAERPEPLEQFRNRDGRLVFEVYELRGTTEAGTAA